jgi:hypothetical protein
MENRNGLLVQAMVTQADGTAERDAALLMASKIPGTQPVTLGGDKNNFQRTADSRLLTGLNGLPHQGAFGPQNAKAQLPPDRHFDRNPGVQQCDEIQGPYQPACVDPDFET